MIHGLSHITLISANLERMEEILTKLLDARKIYDSGETTFSLSPERFYDIAGIWVAVMQGAPLPSRSYNHIAFQIDDADYDHRLALARSLDLDIQEGRPRVEGEGRSIYVYTPDNHLLELHSGTLRARLTRYADAPPPSSGKD